MSDAGFADARTRPQSTARLFAGAMAVALVAAASPGWAQESRAADSTSGQTSPGPPREPDRDVHGAVGPDGLSPDELLLEADQVTRDDANHKLIATGHVQARYQGRTLRGQEIEYDTETQLITTHGPAEVIDTDGTVEYGDHMVLDQHLRAGAATGFASRQTNNIKIAAATAVRRSENITELDRAIFTPCAICTKSGSPSQPTWSIQAEKVVDDKDRRLVFYRHAVIRVKGIPIFYAPILWTPDANAGATSGFFPPRVSVSRRRGFSYEQPYLWVISPSQDLEISPQINTKLNPFLNFDYRKRFWSGELDARFGYTYEADSNSEGDRFGPETSRSYILADGLFQIDRNWRWGFSAERTSDPTLFDRYDTPNVYENRGLFDDEQRRLTSQLYSVRQDDQSYISVSALAFQSLRPFVDPITGQFFKNPQTGQLLVENDKALPVIMPMAEARWDPQFPILGGRVRLQASGVSLTQNQALLDPCGPGSTEFHCTPPLNIPGIDEARVTVQGEWRWTYVAGGARFDPYLSARGDAYSVDDIPGFTSRQSIQRGDATAGLDFSYPLVRRFDGGSLVIEPLLYGAISPSIRKDDRVPNLDSLSFNLDENNLFSPDKFSGFDVFEGGARLNAGVRFTANWDNGPWGWFLFGRSFRTNEAYPITFDGLNQDLKDWVVAFQTTPMKGLMAFARANIDDRGNFQRGEAGIDWDFSRAHGYVRYFKDDLDPFQPGFRREDAELSSDLLITRHWGLVVDVTRDLQAHLWRRSEAGVLYQDDCIRAALVYQRNETGLLGPTDAVFLHVNLPILGSAGFKRYDDH
jgi:LPS-assembly protein